jgi:iron complex outermembrane recepter protein
MKNRYLSTSCRLALLPALALPLAATAQVALEEIVVTATKRAESLQDIPIAVSTLSGEDLTNSGIDSQRALALTTPNVAINFNANFVAPYIRGVGTQYANPGLEPSVATYFNDVYLARASSGMMNFFDIERVEVLKGPQGTLYGRNTTGGAIRVITRDPTPEFEAGLALGIGNYSKRTVDAFVSGPITDNLMGRLAVATQDRDGYMDNIVGGPDPMDRDMEMIHGKLLWEISDRLRAKLDFDWTNKEDFDGVGFASLFDGAPGMVGAALGGVTSQDHYDFAGDVQNYAVPNDFQIGGTQLRVDYEFDTFTFSSITGYRINQYKGRADLDGSSLPLFDAYTLTESTKDFSQEIQLVSNGEGDIDWLFGIFYYEEDGEDDFGLSGTFIGTDEFGAPNTFIGSEGEIDIKSFAPYAQLAYEITDTLEFMVGVRYTEEEKDVDNYFFLTGVDGIGAPTKPYLFIAPSTPDHFEFSKTTPKVQFTWRPTEDTMFYASYSEGLKSGGFNLPNPSPGPVPKVRNEVIRASEIGWKTEFDRIRFNGAIFHYKIEDLQLQITDPNAGITAVTNAGTSEVDGIEGDLTFAATENLELGAGFGYQKTEFGDIPGGLFNPLCADFAPGDPSCGVFGLGVTTLTGNLKGNEVPQAPELTGYLRAAYFLPLGDSGSIAFTGVASYQDNFYWTADNLYEEPSKTLVNLTATWTSPSERYVVGTYVTNATDEEYNTHNAPFEGSGGWRVPGEPRMYGVRAAVNFD